MTKLQKWLDKIRRVLGGTYIIVPMLVLLLVGCGSAPQLTKEFCSREQARAYSYYDMRAHGMAFSSEFYNESDSIRATIPASASNLLHAYISMAIIRKGDSTGAYRTFQSARDLISSDFEFSKGGAK